MKNLTACLTCVIVSVGAAAQPPELIWETPGFIGPESVVYDVGTDEFYVSNMGTYGGKAAPGDGFISRVSAEGKILELKWISGLENPKGLALANGRLYVGDDPGLVEIDPAAGRIIARHAPADGPGGFNDCTADPSGNIYVYSSRRSTVFRFSAGRLEPWYQLDVAKTGSVNGLKAERDRLLLGGWSLRGPGGVEQPGHISTVTLTDRKLARLGDQPLGHIDGLEPDGRGSYTVTDWMTGDVLLVSAEGHPTLIMKLAPGIADHAYLQEKQLLLIPQVKENVLRAYRWKP